MHTISLTEEERQAVMDGVMIVLSKVMPPDAEVSVSPEALEAGIEEALNAAPAGVTTTVVENVELPAIGPQPGQHDVVAAMKDIPYTKEQLDQIHKRLNDAIEMRQSMKVANDVVLLALHGAKIALKFLL